MGFVLLAVLAVILVGAAYGFNVFGLLLVDPVVLTIAASAAAMVVVFLFARQNTSGPLRRRR